VTATRTIRGFPPRLFGYALAIVAIGLPITAGAAVRFLVLEPPSLRTAVGTVVFFACALGAELKPVSRDVAGKRVVSLAFIFVISAQILYGWQASVLVGAGAMLVAMATGWPGLLKSCFNCSVYAIAAALASLANLGGIVSPHGQGAAHYGALIGVVFASGAIFIVTNVVLVCLAMSMAEDVSPVPVIVDHFRHSGRAFFIMGFMAALAVSLWTIEPLLLVLLAGPLLTLDLYQRYALSTRVARQAAETDSLTGLHNHRAFEHEIEVAVEGATLEAPVTLCLVDVDNFKGVNDTKGHAMGDRALAEVAAALASVENAQAFRLGGDEFALIVLGSSDEATAAIKRIQRDVARKALELDLPVTVSVGLAQAPQTSVQVEQLQRFADMALYWTKRHGKNRWCVYSPEVVELSWSAEAAATADYAHRARVAENLLAMLRERAPCLATHSDRVAENAEQLSLRLGLDQRAAQDIALAGRLHDIGKVGLSDTILHKPGRLTADEAAAMRRHPALGAQLLQGLDWAPIDDWILHHHEHWDGTGYPESLSGAEIPLAARIIFVVDAYDAMTSDRSYRPAMDPQFALAELKRFAGRQFDPEVVDAFVSLMSGRATCGRSSVAELGA
jgi:diguanylate cyclase (GGDEF)-like protein